MTGKFSMDDYVDVAERISVFAKKYADGSLQSELEAVRNDAGLVVGWLCKAYAYRSADDTRPGVGHAFEPVPGKTPYTRDSEAMNAETSAWGRAIVALGFPTKKIASANEVRNRATDKPAAKPPPPADDDIPFPAPTAPRGSKKQPTEAQLRKLNVTVGQLRDAQVITTEHLWLRMSVERGIDLDTMIEMLSGKDGDGVLHWAPLRDSLTGVEASGLIDRLAKLQEKEAA